MSHKKLLTRGIFFSYAALLAQIAYSFFSIPLALSHLSTEQFGLWGLVSTIGGFLLMAELGLTESFMRYLYECKDGRDPERYGRLFTASCIALGIVALVVLLGGILVAFFAAPWLKIPEVMRRDFTLTMIGAATMGAVSMGSRMLGIPLVLHHRQDLSQISQLVLFLVRFVVLVLAFQAGWGLYSFLAVEAASIFWCLPFNAVACQRNGYYPKAKTLGLPLRSEWSEIRNYSLGAFMIQVGSTLLTGLPQFLISSLAGLHAAGLWTVCTRVFGILRDIAFRPFGIAVPILIDLFVRGEVARSIRRWVHASQLVVAAAGLFFGIAAAHNGRFVQLWAGVGSEWGPAMHLCVATYFLCWVAASCPYGTISFSKEFGIARVVPVLQGLVVAAIAFPISQRFGSGGVILSCATGFLAGMLFFGMRQLGLVTGENPWRLFLSAIARPFAVAPLVFAVAWWIAGRTTAVPGYPGLFLSGGLSFLAGLPLMAYLGVSSEVRGELFGMLLRPFRRFLPSAT